VALLAIAAAAACTSNPPQSAGPSGPGTAIASGATATVQPGPTFGPPPSPTPGDDATPVALDPTLISILPAAIDGIPVQEDIDEAAVALNDAVVQMIAGSVDAGVAVDAGNGNLVYGWIVKLKPDVFNADKFRLWRDSYDEGACSAAGGVVGRAEAEIGGRTAYVTSCVTGLHTYHVWLQDQDILISASSVGEGRFGEKLLEGLRVPA
jgi:hypothetical protein